jgi:hypothetical protein
MTTYRLIFAGVFELIALAVIARMWMKRRHSGTIVRLLWTIVLLVPVFGLLTYFFLRESPDSHPEYIEESSYGYTESRGPDGH